MRHTIIYERRWMVGAGAGRNRVQRRRPLPHPQSGSIRFGPDVEYRVGEPHRIGRKVFHEGTAVDADTGTFTPSSRPDGFVDPRLREINLHQQ